MFSIGNRKVLMEILNDAGERRMRWERRGGDIDDKSRFSVRSKTFFISAASTITQNSSFLPLLLLFAIVFATRNPLFESFGERKCWQISERGASTATAKRNQWWKTSYSCGVLINLPLALFLHRVPFTSSFSLPLSFIASSSFIGSSFS